jgi:hypothetical protein
MVHVFDFVIGQSARVDARSPAGSSVMRFAWKADRLVIESGEYTLMELENMLREMNPTESRYKQCASALEELRKLAGRG